MSDGAALAIILLAALSNRGGASRAMREKEEKDRLEKYGSGNKAIAMRSPVRGFGRGDPFFDPWAEGGKFNPKR